MPPTSRRSRLNRRARTSPPNSNESNATPKPKSPPGAANSIVSKPASAATTPVSVENSQTFEGNSVKSFLVLPRAPRQPPSVRPDPTLHGPQTFRFPRNASPNPPTVFLATVRRPTAPIALSKSPRRSQISTRESNVNSKAKSVSFKCNSIHTCAVTRARARPRERCDPSRRTRTPSCA